MGTVVIVTAIAVGRGEHAGAEEPTPDQVVSAMETNFGVNPGQRRNHIKGTCAAGEFVGTPEAAAISRSALFNGAAIPVVARFSLASGNPKLPDTSRGVRGLALQFRLPRGVHDMAMLNTPVFGAAVPATFHDALVAARSCDRQARSREIEGISRRPSGCQTPRRVLARNNRPASYVDSAYKGIHIFKLIDAARATTLARRRFVPDAGEKQLTEDAMKAPPPDFLEARPIEATTAGPQRWTMIVTVGQAGDPETDSTKAWPADRREIEAGTLTISSATPQKGAECEPINFGPLTMAAGIEPTDDPILLFRSPAYAVPYSKRFDGKQAATSAPSPQSPEPFLVLAVSRQIGRLAARAEVGEAGEHR